MCFLLSVFVVSGSPKRYFEWGQWSVNKTLICKNNPQKYSLIMKIRACEKDVTEFRPGNMLCTVGDTQTDTITANCGETFYTYIIFLQYTCI